MVKYLNTRNANTAKHSKLAKSKTKLQKGGSAAAAVAPIPAAEDIISISKDDLLAALSAYADIKTLISNTFTVADTFTYKSTSTELKTSDPFLTTVKPEDGEYNLDNLHEWYLTKNPGFLPISEVKNLYIPEFAFITAVIVKDLVILLQTCKFPQKHKNNTNAQTNININKVGKSYGVYARNTIKLNQKKLNSKNKRNNFTHKLITNIASLLRFIDKFIKEGYIYLEFLEILKSYILIFSLGKNVKHDNDNPEYDQVLKHIDYLKNQPYILYPSTEQLDYNKVIYTMQAPFINFRLPNVRPKIHGVYFNILFELEHDIFFHGKYTHKLIPNTTLLIAKLDEYYTLQLILHLKEFYKIKLDIDYYSQSPIIPNTISRDIYKEIFKDSNFIIKELKEEILQYYKKQLDPEFKIKNPNSNPNIDTKDIIYIFTVFMFLILHENGGLQNLFDLKNAFYTLIDDLNLMDVDLVEQIFTLTSTKKIMKRVYDELKEKENELQTKNNQLKNIVSITLLNYILSDDCFIKAILEKIQARFDEEHIEKETQN